MVPGESPVNGTVKFWALVLAPNELGVATHVAPVKSPYVGPIVVDFAPVVL